MAAKCALRWRAHHEELQTLQEVLGRRIMLLNYEVLQGSTQTVLGDLRLLLGLHAPIAPPYVRQASLDKWKHQLSSEETRQIQEVVGFAPDSV